MGYHPNLFAKSLVEQKSKIIGLLVYDYKNTFYADFARFLQELAYEAGYIVFQANTDDNTDKTERLVNSMLSIGVDGIVCAAARFDDHVIKKLIEDGFPVGLVNRHLEEGIGDYVVLDNEYGAYLAVSHLYNLGRRRIAIIKGTVETSTGSERFSGYLKAIKEIGLKPDDKIIKQGVFSQKSGHQLTRSLMRQDNPPDAIFCGDDEIALGAIAALDELGLSIPEDVAIVGFDDNDISSHSRIQLTTISQNVEKMAMLGLDNLLRRIENPQREFEHVVLQPNLIIRQSCGSRMRNQTPSNK